jgi:hypothetical protein
MTPLACDGRHRSLRARLMSRDFLLVVVTPDIGGR